MTNPLEMQPLALAFIGDAVYEQYIREYIIGLGYRTINEMHKQAIKYVKAASQAAAVKALSDELNDIEKSVVRRGRNAHPHTVPKNANITDYRYATALEALIGYLYLSKQTKRLNHIMKRTTEIINEQ